MIRVDVHREKGERFKVLKTTEHTQLGMMTIPPNQSVDNEDGHLSSDQVLYVVEGRIELTLGEETAELRAGEVVVIPASTPHHMRAVGRRSATIFNVYGPPAYPAEEEAPLGVSSATSAHSTLE